MNDKTGDDVNAQHLAAMGLAGKPLGEKFEERAERGAAPEGQRCNASHVDGSSIRCARQTGHDGSHARGTITWDGDGPTLVTGNVEVRHGEPQPCPEHPEFTVHHMGGECPKCGWTPSRPTKQREGDQRLPDGGHECVQDLVIAAMQESKRVGQERYGSPLMTFNGRKGIQDVQEEARDFFVYLTQVAREADADRATLIGVTTEALTEEWLRRSYERGDRAVTVQRLAEIAVDRIMGWVVGHRMQNQTLASELTGDRRCVECGGLRCSLADCNRPYDQGEARICVECGKFQATCANDHCVECGSAT